MIYTILILVSYFLVSSNCISFVERASLNLGAQITHLEYSDDHEQLVAMSIPKKMLYVFNAVTMKEVQIIELSYQPTSLALSNYFQYLFIGSMNGSVFFYIQNQEDNKYYQRQELKSEVGEGINCLSLIRTTNAYLLAIGGKTQAIYIWKIFDLTTNLRPKLLKKIQLSQEISTVGWSSSSKDLFLAGDNTMKIYNSTRDYLQIGSFDFSSKISFLKFSIDGSLILVGGQGYFLKIFTWEGYILSDELVVLGQTSLQNAFVSQNNQYICITTSSKVYIYRKMGEERTWTLNQTIPIALGRIAFSRAGTEIAVISSSNTITIYSLCPSGTYYNNQQAQCYVCGSSCSTCHETPNYCFSCVGQRFLYNNKCNFCSSGTHLQGQVCISNGLKTWVIVLIVLGSIIVGFALSFVIYLIWKRSQKVQKTNPLLQQKGEEQDKNVENND